MPNKNKAKKIIIEIIRESGGKFEGKVRLYKAFYLAHLMYASKYSGWIEELSDWPLVVMPQGPGIDSGKELLEELIDEDYIKLTNRDFHGYQQNVYTICEKEYDYPLAQKERQIIHDAVELINGINGSKLSQWTHKNCNSWKHFNNGEKINIHHDLMSEAEFLEMRKKNKWATELVCDILCGDNNEDPIFEDENKPVGNNQI